MANLFGDIGLAIGLQGVVPPEYGLIAQRNNLIIQQQKFAEIEEQKRLQRQAQIEDNISRGLMAVNSEGLHPAFQEYGGLLVSDLYNKIATEKQDNPYTYKNTADRLTNDTKQKLKNLKTNSLILNNIDKKATDGSMYISNKLDPFMQMYKTGDGKDIADYMQNNPTSFGNFYGKRANVAKIGYDYALNSREIKNTTVKDASGKYVTITDDTNVDLPKWEQTMKEVYDNNINNIQDEYPAFDSFLLKAREGLGKATSTKSKIVKLPSETKSQYDRRMGLNKTPTYEHLNPAVQNLVNPSDYNSVYKQIDSQGNRYLSPKSLMNRMGANSQFAIDVTDAGTDIYLGKGHGFTYKPNKNQDTRSDDEYKKSDKVLTPTTSKEKVFPTKIVRFTNQKTGEKTFALYTNISEQENEAKRAVLGRELLPDEEAMPMIMTEQAMLDLPDRLVNMGEISGALGKKVTEKFDPNSRPKNAQTIKTVNTNNSPAPAPAKKSTAPIPPITGKMDIIELQKLTNSLKPKKK